MKLQKRTNSLMVLHAMSLLFFISLFICIPKQAEAKTTGYTTLHSNSTFGYSYNGKMTMVKKVGNTYMKCVYKSVIYEAWDGLSTIPETGGVFYYSTKKNSGFQKFLTTEEVYNDIATNGKSYVYIKLNRGDEASRSSDLICKDIGKSTETNLYHFNGDNFVKIIGASGNHIYLRSEVQLRYYYYDVDISTKRVSKVEVNPDVRVLAQEGTYAIADNLSYIGIYRFVSGKLKKVKNLVKSNNGAPDLYGAIGIIGGKVYYVDTGGGFSRSILKRCSLSGKNKKVLGKFKRNGNTGKIKFMKATSRYCIIRGRSNFFKYIYKGKKFKKITKKKFKKELSHMGDVLK